MNKIIWEILVPTMMNDNPVRTRHHREWDKQVKKITGGLTITPPGKGYWVDPNGEIDFFSNYPSIEIKKNKIIVRVLKYKFFRNDNFLEAGYVYAPYIPLTHIDITFNITKDGIEENNDN